MPDRHPAPLVLGSLFVLMGFLVGTGGVWLIALGGSWYYLPGGLVLILTGLLLLQRNPAALWVHAAMLTVTLAWSVWEAGLNWWPLAARGDVLFFCGLIMLTPWFSRGLLAAARQPARQALTAALGAFAAIAVLSWFQSPAGSSAPAMAQAAEPAPLIGTAVAKPGEGLSHPLPPHGASTGQPVGLEVAWQYRASDLRTANSAASATVMAGKHLFLCTSQASVVALDATTGAEAWRRDLGVLEDAAGVPSPTTCGPMSYQPQPAGADAPRAVHAVLTSASSSPAHAACEGRLLVTTSTGHVLALNPSDGRPCSDVGNGLGSIPLLHLLDARHRHAPSTVAATQDLLLVAATYGTGTPASAHGASIHAYDLRTGAAAWQWQAAAAGMPHHPDSLAGIDEALGLLYIPVSRPTASGRQTLSVVALDLKTGHVRWQFQTHERTTAATSTPWAPRLMDLKLAQTVVPALVHPTPQGEVLVLDRRTGVPMLPARADAASALSIQPVTGADMWGVTLFDQLICRIAFERFRFEDRFAPQSPTLTQTRSGHLGRFHWPAAPNALQWADGAGPDITPPARTMRGGEARMLRVQSPDFATGKGVAGAAPTIELQPFLSPLGLPCQAPGWSRIAPPSPATTPTPLTYNGTDGRQYLLVNTEEPGSPQTPGGDWLVAYAVPSA